jgi:hypothetical protein
MNQPQATRSDCIGMIGAAIVELLEIASREDLRAAMAFWGSARSTPAWDAVESVRLVEDRIAREAAVSEGPLLGPM